MPTTTSEPLHGLVTQDHTLWCQIAHSTQRRSKLQHLHIGHRSADVQAIPAQLHTLLTSRSSAPTQAAGLMLCSCNSQAPPQQPALMPSTLAKHTLLSTMRPGPGSNITQTRVAVPVQMTSPDAAAASPPAPGKADAAPPHQTRAGIGSGRLTTRWGTPPGGLVQPDVASEEAGKPPATPQQAPSGTVLSWKHQDSRTSGVA